MKRVRGLPAEPPLLGQYRSDNPHEDRRPAAEATAAWRSFKVDTAAYEQLRNQLAIAQCGLCLYCEQRLLDSRGEFVFNDYQVEHVLAKSGGAGRTLDWRNLALCCGGGTYRHHTDATRRYAGDTNATCGQSKDDADLPPGCDPRTIPLLGPLVFVTMEGTLRAHIANCSAANVDPKHIDDAIQLLNLNCERLRVARQSVYSNITAWLVPVLEMTINSSHATPAQQQLLFDTVVAAHLQPDQHGYLTRFWSTERSAFGSHGDSWVRNNPSIV